MLNGEIKMGYVSLGLARNFMVRVKHDADLIQFTSELAAKNGIKVATFTAIGALKRAKLAFYDQEKQEYHEIKLDAPYEIASCVGNISMKNGTHFVHAHVVLADKEGNTRAGHMLEGIVFATELHLQELRGAKLERKNDKLTGLSLWDMTKPKL
jgi:predicted DNA-binding protein with PD1-like motif